MIKQFVKNWEENKDSFKLTFSERHPENYQDIVKEVIKTITYDSNYAPNPRDIQVIREGSFEGAFIFIIGSYNKEEHWYVRVFYGPYPASGTLESIKNKCLNRESKPTKEQIEDYTMLGSYIVQKIRDF